jgi:dienelactone hydrolase
MFWNESIDPAKEPLRVLLKRGDFMDAARGRKIPYKIYYPSGEGLGKVPVIVWSHGYGGNRDGAGFISRYVASHGYVVVHVTHLGSDSSLWEGKPGHPWDILRKSPITREMTVERFKDIPVVLDALPAWTAEHPDAGAHMDLDTLGMSGHSFGAMTTQAMAGQKFPGDHGDDHGVLSDFREARFKAGIAYSPVPNRKLYGEAPEKYLYGPIAIPMFYMTGTKDDSPLEGFTYDQRVVVYEYSGHAEKYLMVLKDGDHMVYNGTRGKLEPNPLREKHEEILKMFSLAYWDAYLKGDAAAMAWLKGGAAAAYLNGAGSLKTP